MTSYSSTAYPAEYYYPEFIESRPDDPLKSPDRLPLTTSIDKGVGSTTKTGPNDDFREETTVMKPTNKKPGATSFAHDIVTNQGLPEADITKAVKTDPKKNLVRDPAEKNIPRLIVDESVIKQSTRTPRVATNNLENDKNDANSSNPTDPNKKVSNKNNPNGDTKTNSRLNGIASRQQTVKVINEEEPIDDYWQKQILVDEEGLVTVEPIKYDKETYDGPFGLTRTGSFVFYIGMGLFTLLAAVFLIMTGVFYSQNYPSESSKTGLLTGMGICGLALYIGLLLILIGLWHQKYRQENPKRIVTKSRKRPNSRTQLKSSMEANESYDYPYGQYNDYAPYGYYPNPPYASNVNEQMLLQQPGAAAGTGYYDPVVWPSNVEVETQIDPKFYQPMDFSYVSQSTNPTKIPTPSESLATNNTKPEKKNHRSRHKTVEAEPPKAALDNIFPNSTALETTIPNLKKAPETEEIMRKIAEMERDPQSISKSGSLKQNQVKPENSKNNTSSSNDPQHRSSRRHRHHHHNRRRRHRSYSSCSTCSTCSSRSYDDYYSDAAFNSNSTFPKNGQPYTHTTRSRRASTPSPRRTTTNGKTVTGRSPKRTKGSNTKAELEDVPNVRDNRLEQLPVVRRTVIVEPYPAKPTSTIVVQPNKDTGKGKKKFAPNVIRVPQNSESIRDNHGNILEDLQLEDINDSDYVSHEKQRSPRKNKTSATTSKNARKNAFYN